MPTDVRLLTIEDLCNELGVLYRDAGRRHDAIRAEILRRIEVRDRVVKYFMYSGLWPEIEVCRDGMIITVKADKKEYSPTYFDKQGEQIL